MAPIRSLAVVVVAVVALLALPATATGPVPHPSLTTARAATFAVSLVKLMGQSRYDVAWQHLHPAHQAVAPRETYIACEQASPLPHVATVKVAHVRAVWVAVPGIPGRVAGHAVDLLTTFTQPGLDPYTVRHTVHVVALTNRPVWILPLARYHLYASGGCPLHGS
jgi:hypothetical protein